MSASDLSMAMPMSIAAPKGKILCVDDEPNVLRALCWLLQKEFEVVTAAGGQEALELVRQNDFDVVISDQRMPEMSGVDLLREVSVAAPRAMRILLTGYSDLNAVLRSVNESEIFRYVTKPWNVAELPRIVAQASEIARSRVAPPAAANESATKAAKILVLNDDIEIHAAVALCVGDLARVVHVTSLADAVHHLQEVGTGVIVGEAGACCLDVPRLVCLMKQRHPHVVSVMLAQEAATDLVTKLVNQGQVFRFLPKPIKAGEFRETLRQALEKSRQLYEQPELRCRHEVEELSPQELAALESDLSAGSPVKADAKPDSSLSGRVGAVLRRLFAGVNSHA